VLVVEKLIAVFRERSGVRGVVKYWGKNQGRKRRNLRDDVEGQCADETEDHETGCVLSSTHFDRGINAGEVIDPSFHWSPHGIQQRSSPGKDAIHVTAERPDTERENHDEEKILNCAVQAHWRATRSPQVNQGECRRKSIKKE